MKTRTIKDYGGARYGAGRKREDGTSGPLIPVNMTIRADQRPALAALGGSVWLRRMIDQETDNQKAKQE